MRFTRLQFVAVVVISQLLAVCLLAAPPAQPMAQPTVPAITVATKDMPWTNPADLKEGDVVCLNITGSVEEVIDEMNMIFRCSGYDEKAAQDGPKHSLLVLRKPVQIWVTGIPTDSDRTILLMALLHKLDASPSSKPFETIWGGGPDAIKMVAKRFGLTADETEALYSSRAWLHADEKGMKYRIDRSVIDKNISDRRAHSVPHLPAIRATVAAPKDVIDSEGQHSLIPHLVNCEKLAVPKSSDIRSGPNKAKVSSD